MISLLALGFCCRASSSKVFASLKAIVPGNGGGFKASENDGRASDESSSYGLDLLFPRGEPLSCSRSGSLRIDR